MSDAINNTKSYITYIYIHRYVRVYVYIHVLRMSVDVTLGNNVLLYFCTFKAHIVISRFIDLILDRPERSGYDMIGGF
jgi:hypothetical protein